MILLVWLKFSVAAGLIVLLGWRLSICGDIIAEKTGLGHVWVGALLLAGATTLPEVVTSLSAVIVERAPDLAMGNIVGSILFNLFIFAVLDVVEGKGPILERVSSGLVLSAGISIALLLLVVLGLMQVIKIEVFSVGLISLIIGLSVLTGMRLIFNFDSRPLTIPGSGEINGKEQQAREKPESKYRQVSLKKTVAVYFMLAGFVFICGTKLTNLADEIAEMTVLSRTFVGTLFLAVVTSLPELAVTISAVRRGLFDMAASNIFGANIYNVFIVFLADICYRKGSFFASLNAGAHMITAVLALLASIIVVIGLIYKSKKAYMRLGWDTILIAVVYVIGMGTVFYR